MSQSEQNIGNYLLTRLHQYGVNHLFGVPGDYILGFYDLLAHHAITHIGTTREDTAAFAADGYARCTGMGCLAVTYGVGALNVVNAVAGAFAESSPVVVISGAPGITEQEHDPLIHHKFGPFNFQREIFERITCATEVINDPLIAFRQIDRALAMAKRHHAPVYIELPRDRVHLPGVNIKAEPVSAEQFDTSALQEALDETVSLFQAAKNPAILVGVELHRSSLQDGVVELVKKLNVPVASTLTGKSVVGERDPAYAGVYEGAMGSDVAKKVIEEADLVLILGVRFNDIDLGIYTAQLDPYKIIRASHQDVFIRHHRYHRIDLVEYITGLTRRLQAHRPTAPDLGAGPQAEGFPRADTPMTVERLIGYLNQNIPADLSVVSDVGDCLFASIDLRVHRRTQYLASAYYTSMGFAMPAALGVHCAAPDRRALILVGDGAFQMTGTELSTLARHRFNPIVIVFNNKGYSTERFILEGPFNDIMPWQFHELCRVFGPMDGYAISNEAEFAQAFTTALAQTDRPSLLNVQLLPDDSSSAMRRLAAHLSSKV